MESYVDVQILFLGSDLKGLLGLLAVLLKSSDAALDLIDHEYLKEKAVFPDEETIGRCESLVTLDAKTTDLYSDYWKKVKAE